MKQDDKFISSRDKLKQYFSFRKMLGNSSTYGKTSGCLFNNITNGDLTDADLANLNTMLKTIKVDHKEAGEAIKTFEKQLRK